MEYGTEQYQTFAKSCKSRSTSHVNESSSLKRPIQYTGWGTKTGTFFVPHLRNPKSSLRRAPAGGRPEQNSVAAEIQPIHQPNRQPSVGMLPDDIALAVAVEIPDSNRAESGTGTENDCPAADTQSIHQPDGGAAIRVLPQNVALAVAVEIANLLDAPS